MPQQGRTNRAVWVIARATCLYQGRDCFCSSVFHVLILAPERLKVWYEKGSTAKEHVWRLLLTHLYEDYTTPPKSVPVLYNILDPLIRTCQVALIST